MSRASTQLEIAAQWLAEAAIVLSLMGKEERVLSRTLDRVSKECKAVAKGNA